MLTIQKNVIKALECCVTLSPNAGKCENCEYAEQFHNGDCETYLLRDALALLKEQEPVRAVKLRNTMTTFRDKIVFEYACPNCYSYLMRTWKACPVCGKAVKWND